jgi:uncharacterized protein YjbJ (UPF0337 family)
MGSVLEMAVRFFCEADHKQERRPMDKDRIAGAAKKAQGEIKQVIGEAIGDSKLVADGKSDQVKGKIQNAIGGIKDSLKE